MNYKNTYFLLVLILSSELLFGQTKDSIIWLNDSSKAIQFGIGNNFNVQSFTSKSISFKKHLSAESAIRIGFVISGSSNKGETITRDFVNDTLASSYTRTYTPTYSLTAGVSTLYLSYLSTQSDFYLFWGLGPQVRYDRSEYLSNSYYDQNKTWSVGMEGSVGAEWFASHRFSIHAEYLATALYVTKKGNGWSTSGTGSRYTVEYTDNNSTSWRVDSGTVVFGLSVYF